MTLQHFNRLSNGQKYSVLEEKAIYLDIVIINGEFQVALFALDNYYVEVWLHRKSDQLKKAIAFKSYAKLDPFVKEIDITPIYSVL